MKLTAEEKQAIAKSQRIHSVIGDQLKKNDDSTGKLDLTDIAKGLAERRTNILKGESEE